MGHKRSGHNTTRGHIQVPEERSHVTASELARRIGKHPRSIHRWAKLGLLPRPVTTYCKDDVRS